MIYLVAILIGITLGLMGSGGSILTVPALVYITGLNPLMATGYSLFIVGTTSLTGVIVNKKNINYKIGLLFALPSVATVILVRKLVLPIIPEVVFYWGDHSITKNFLLMSVLSLFMLLSAFSILKKENSDIAAFQHPKWKIIVYGLITGMITGFLGAGGGFLVIPALLVFFHLPLKTAITTSLFIIAVNALSGFVSDTGFLRSVDWILLISFTGLSVMGILTGTYLTKFIPARKLKLFFGWFLLVMAVFITIKELNNL